MVEQTNPDSGGPDGPTSKSGSGLEPNVAAALCYVLTWVTGIIFLLVEKDDYVRFHAKQAIVFGVASTAVWIVLSLIFPLFLAVVAFMPLIGGLIAGLLSALIWLVLGLGFLVLWVILMVKAYRGQRFALPIIGEFAKNWNTG
jgi:uncharacterized membrane protein